MSKIRNRTILITGGASGIGKLLATKCLEKGAHQVILWDINAAALEQCAAEFKAKGHDTPTYVVDVSKTDDIEQAGKRVLKEHGAVDILFNNAGIVVGKEFADHTHQDIDRTISINVSGVMHCTRAFLPAMIEQEEGHIVNIASAAGLMPNPHMSVYAGSKWAVVGWSESLRIELELSHPNLHVTTVEPSYINTGMFDGVKAPLLTPLLDPNFIADKIIRAVETNTIILREPFMVKAVPALRGMLPTRAFDFVAKRFGVYDSMETFKGRR